MNRDLAAEIRKVQTFLTHYLGGEPDQVQFLGAGAWSRCFGFSWKGHARVVRFGKYVADFEKDQRAFRYATAELPVPKLLEIGTTPEGYFAISARVYGAPLENVRSSQWHALLPAVIDALEAMRTADLGGVAGFGGWGTDGNAPHSSWSARLLAVAKDRPEQRGHGWRAALANFPQAEAAFARGYALLLQVADDAVPRSLLHCDLTNRNVFVAGERITGIFDWGCSIYGDHLYEVALFEFWSPWQPQLDIAALKQGLARRWAEQGYTPLNMTERLRACHLHIGLEHIAYHAQLGNGEMLQQVAERMEILASRL